MEMKVTQIVDCGDNDVTFGYIVTDERFDVQEEIQRIKNSEEFYNEYGDGWCIDDVFEHFSFPFHWLDYDTDCIAEI